MSVGELLEAAARELSAVDSPRLDAEVLLAHVLGTARTTLAFRPERPVSDPEAVARYRALVSRRARGEPVAYLTGEREFWSLPLRVTPATLVPRPETELLVELALALGPTGQACVADLGTGSGAVALALAGERPLWSVLASDLDGAALAVARANVERLAPGRVGLLRGHWCACLAERAFDLIVSNPPYVDPQDPALARGELSFEPRRALAAERSGLAALAELAATAPACLRPGGHLLLEHGSGQGAAVRALLQEGGLSEVATARDLAGLERVSHGRRPL